MKKLLFWPYQIYAWLVLIPLAAMLSFIAGWLATLTAILVSPRFSSRYVAMNWARALAWLTPMRVQLEGSEHIDTSRSYVVVANHLSLFDIPALYGWLDLDLKWVIKQELRKAPGIGIGCEKVGHIFIDRKNPEQARKQINAALERLGNGIGILFFPEGTRSPDGNLLPFKKGAFRVAIEAQIPILPVTVVGTHEICPAKTLKIFPGRVRLVAHPVIETQGRSLNDLGSLRDTAQTLIASALPTAETT
mgnify:CR=1 FL=1